MTNINKNIIKNILKDIKDINTNKDIVTNGTLKDIIIENNDNFVVLNKPAGIPVQSGTKSFKNIIDILKNTEYFKIVSLK